MRSAAPLSSHTSQHRPRPRILPWAAAALAVALAASSCGSGTSLPETTETIPTTTTAPDIAETDDTPATPSAEATTSERPAHPQEADVAEDSQGDASTGSRGDDVVSESTAPDVAVDEQTPSETTEAPTDPVLSSLGSLRIEPEDCEGYDREHYDKYPEDTEVANWSGWIDYLTGEPLTAAEAEVEHVVALQEAWCSGGRDPSIGNDTDNLLLMASGWNRSKAGKDPNEWTSERYEWRGQPGACFYLQRHVEVKAKHGMSLDTNEATTIRDYWMERCTTSS